MRGSALNFVPRDCEAEARPADETAEAEQGPRSAFRKRPPWRAAKTGNRNHQGEGISAARLRAEMGSPWSVALLRHADRSLYGGGRCAGIQRHSFCQRAAWACSQRSSSGWLNPGGSMTAAAKTGPASGPLPASSHPASSPCSEYFSSRCISLDTAISYSLAGCKCT